MKIQDFKMRVTPEQSKIVQETLFENGCRWHGGLDKIKIMLTTSECLFLKDKKLSQTPMFDKWFIDKNLPELTFDQFKQKYIDKPNNMFRKGDYIVFLGPAETTNFKLNHCYKQSKDYRYLLAEKGLTGVPFIGRPSCENKNSDDWRYATPKEKAHYDLIGKPFNVNDLVLPEINNNPWTLGGDIKINPLDFTSMFATGYSGIYNPKLKEEKTMKGNKKLIGYRLKDESFAKAVDALSYQALYKNVKNGLGYYGVSYNPQSIKLFAEAGVLDLWFEPVYEEEKELPTINDYKGQYNTENDTIKYGCAQFTTESLVSLWEEIKAFNKDKDDALTPHNRTIASFKLNTGVDIRIGQLNQIVEYIDSKK